MRHRKLKGKLGVTSAHREAMMRNLLLALLKHERIKTTAAKAKFLKRYAEKIIQIGKKDDLPSRRKARISVHDKDMLKKLFTVYGPRFKDRQGGYTRIFKFGNRRGDAAPISMIEILPDPSKENEPRIIKKKRVEEPVGPDAQNPKALKRKAKQEHKHLQAQEQRAKAESKRAKQTPDTVHSHKSQGRKTEMGTGRSKTSKKGLS